MLIIGGRIINLYHHHPLTAQHLDTANERKKAKYLHILDAIASLVSGLALKQLTQVMNQECLRLLILLVLIGNKIKMYLNQSIRT